MVQRFVFLIMDLSFKAGRETSQRPASNSASRLIVSVSVMLLNQKAPHNLVMKHSMSLKYILTKSPQFVKRH